VGWYYIFELAERCGRLSFFGADFFYSGAMHKKLQRLSLRNVCWLSGKQRQKKEHPDWLI